MHACVCVCVCVVFSLATAAVLKWIYLVWQNIWQVLTHGIFMLCFGQRFYMRYMHIDTLYILDTYRYIYIYIWVTCTIVAVYISGSWAAAVCGRDSCQQQRKAAQNGTKALNLAVHCAGLFKNICLLGSVRDPYKRLLSNTFSKTIIHRIALLPVCDRSWKGSIQFCLKYKQKQPCRQNMLWLQAAGF